MDEAGALTRVLTLLTEAASGPSIDLDELTRQLSDSLSVTIDSFVGHTLIAAGGGPGFSLTSLTGDANARVVTSALVPLPVGRTTQARFSLVVYASTFGALTDFVADMCSTLGLTASDVLIDGHLSPTPEPRSRSAFVEHSTVNQAIGVLLDRGHLRSDARSELRRRAAHNNVSLLTQAEQLLNEHTHRPEGTSP